MDRTTLQRLAYSRLADAEVLLQAERWNAAYYISGYVLECALKSCVLKYVGESRALFGESVYLKELSKCWTHDLQVLVRLAGLEQDLNEAKRSNPLFCENWNTAMIWRETARYKDEIDESEARKLVRAIDDAEEGVFRWIQLHW